MADRKRASIHAGWRENKSGCADVRRLRGRCCCTSPLCFSAINVRAVSRHDSANTSFSHSQAANTKLCLIAMETVKSEVGFCHAVKAGRQRCSQGGLCLCNCINQVFWVRAVVVIVKI